jgi:protein SCO1/2
MATVTRRQWLGALGAASVGLTADVVTWAQDASADRPPQRLTGRERIRMHHLPNVELTAHTGAHVHFYDDLVRDKKVIINFMYVKCEGICAPVTMNLVKVKKLLGDRVGRDIFMYSITLKPAEDSPDDLRDYAGEHGAGGSGWLFLTGAPPDVERLRRALGFTFADPVEDADTSNHIGMLRYGVEAATRWAACPGMANPVHVARSILWDLG